ncbi:MAG: hypothetical protein N2322_06675, partial [Terrimicrobiaceae bacterium]|nr:hypothetical protein [Terrimicrobiaceae bacterium]
MKFLSKIGLAGRLDEAQPFRLKSPNHAIAPKQTPLAFLTAVVAGAGRFAHANWPHGERPIHA